MDDFVVARNRGGIDTAYLVRLPLGRDRVVLKVRHTWPQGQVALSARRTGCRDGRDVSPFGQRVERRAGVGRWGGWLRVSLTGLASCRSRSVKASMMSVAS